MAAPAQWQRDSAAGAGRRLSPPRALRCVRRHLTRETFNTELNAQERVGLLCEAPWPVRRRWVRGLRRCLCCSNFLRDRSPNGRDCGATSRPHPAAAACAVPGAVGAGHPPCKGGKRRSGAGPRRGGVRGRPAPPVRPRGAGGERGAEVAGGGGGRQVLHSGLVRLAGFWAHLFSAMRRSVEFNICVVTCSILFLSSSPPCLASQPLEEEDMTKVQYGAWAGNGVEDESTSILNLKHSLSPSEQAVSEEPCEVSAKPSENPSNEAFIGQTPLSPSNIIPGSQGLAAHTFSVAGAPADEEFGPTKSELDEDGAFKAMLTTAVTTLSPAVQEKSVGGLASETTVEDGVEVEHSSAGFLAKPTSGTAVALQGNLGSSATPQTNLYPSSPIWEAAGDHLVTPTPQDHGVTSEVGVPGARTGSPLKSLVAQASVAAKRPVTVTEASLPLEVGTSIKQGELPAITDTVTIHPMDTLPPDWDDTKMGAISQGESTSHKMMENLGATEPPQTSQEIVGEKEDATRLLPSPASPPTLELAKENNCTVPVQGEELPAASTGNTEVLQTVNVTGIDTTDLNSLKNRNTVTAEEKSILPSQPEAAVVTDTPSDLPPTPESSWKGVTQEVTTVTQEADAALSVVMMDPGATQGTGVASLPQENSGEDTQMPTAPGATQMLVAAGTSLMANAPDVEDLTDVVLVTSEKAVLAPGELSATQFGQTEEPSSRTVVLVTPASMASSVRRTALPSARKISTAVTYGLDRLESEGTTDPKTKRQAASCGVAHLP
ncbi:armadillo-like helical domain-containing protein 4 [Pogoniulus pusillus]|uniref:armadillo-like helical domain-containing protein 4 n=1 Tax=Pogoniulus pusillus TaxID=488313 RepID=UPI0030B96C05